MIRFKVAALGLALLSAQARADEYRSVTWFADHPTELSGVLRICRDHKGLTLKNPTCINADEAQYLVTERELKRAGGLGSPFDPAYWRSRPAEQRQQAWSCQMMDKQRASIDPTTRRICSAVRGG